ncbi:MAG: biotin--[acetyl-CoA-carboxylase] ligase [bacterium]
MNPRTSTPDLADRLLRLLRPHLSAPISVSRLLSELKVELPQLTASIAETKKWGYRLQQSETEIRLLSCPDLLNDIEIPHYLTTQSIGRTVHAFQSVQSTNDLAIKLAEEGQPHGAIVVADRQTAGRGRHDRQWHSPAGLGVYVSIILRPNIPPTMAPPMSIVAALALAEVFDGYCPDQTQIKWPNDVLIMGRKAAGILTQLSADQDQVDHIIVGVGININHQESDFPQELSSLATSLRCATGKKHSRVRILAEFLHQLESEYIRYTKEGLAPSQGRLRRFSSLIGRRINLMSGHNRMEAEVLDIDTEGRLVIKTEDGTKAVTSGEVTIVKE